MTLPPLSELRKRYVDDGRALPAELERELRLDARSGAKSILSAIERRRRANRCEGQRLRNMLKYEQPIWASGMLFVAGVDEAGMSPLAGPVSAGAVILPVGWKLAQVDDSKKLDAKTREELRVVIQREAIAWAVAFVEPDEIDRVNIYHAGLLAMRRAVMALSRAPQHLLIDARKLKDVALPQQAIIKGDEKSLSIAAASILAKTARDELMRELDVKHPGYGFAKHKGYPVKEHVAALEKLGACPIHRRSFGPVRKVLGLDPVQESLFPDS